MSDTVSFGLQPIVAMPWIVLFAALGLGLLGLGVARGLRRGLLWRLLALAVLTLALLDPRGARETREARPDVALVLVDESPSQSIDERGRQAEQALEEVLAALEPQPNLEVRVERVPGTGEDSPLLGALDRALAQVPSERFAGAVLITDGQVHDTLPADPPGPLHVLLTGSPGETDRRVAIPRAPGYGLVGRKVRLTARVEDRPGGRPGGLVSLGLRRDGIEIERRLVPLGEPVALSVTLEHGGSTVIEVEADPLEGEIALDNNSAAVVVNGVRDRLRVLLVSGQPHAGERAWRNLLKSDPSVDLVHFTILRPPEKDDFTPLDELSLIEFPVRELFETKLPQFDLVIFDRWVVRAVLPPYLVRNLAEHVKDGGALLVAGGPDFVGPRGLATTPLAQILPVVPDGDVIERPFVPGLTEAGRRHPVTADLDGGRWGRWFRFSKVRTVSGNVLLEGPDGAPILILDRVDDGRVAMLSSDHIWLWARGFEGGGPQGELSRRLAHWLMRQPELEEEALLAKVEDARLAIERRSLENWPRGVRVTPPSGEAFEVDLESLGGGRATAKIEAAETGLYRIEEKNGDLVAFAVSGRLDAPERRDARATPEVLAPLVERSGGAQSWIETGLPEIRRVAPGREASGRGWIGLVANEASAVTGLVEAPLLPGWLLVVTLVGALAAAWWREGRG